MKASLITGIATGWLFAALFSTRASLAADSVDSRLRLLESTVENLVAIQNNLQAQVVKLRSENSVLKNIPAVVKQIGYPIDDQHDTIAISLTEVLADIDANKIETEADKVSFQAMEELFGRGDTPEVTFLSMQLQVKLDELNQQALEWHRKSIVSKMASLEGLRQGAIMKFAELDRETNYEQLQWFNYQLQEAQASCDLAVQFYRRAHEVYLNGAGSWAADHQAETDKRKAERVVAGWQHKQQEQKRQLDASQAELDELRKQAAPAP